MKKAKFNQGYEIEPDGENRLVTFRGDGISWAAYVVFPIGFLVILGFTLPVPFLWPIPIIALIGMGYLIYLMFQKQSFTLTPNGVIKNGVEYEQDRISEILIDNPMDKSIEIVGQPSLIVGGTGVAGASVAAMGAMTHAATSAVVGANLAISRSSAKRRFRVRARYGSKVVTLARNLKQDHAISIFRLLTDD
ncbi:hypothetical protein [Marivita sp. GX14005]|uniref:hypothetical protein n=1 Tax=Marivita sp. GX14005 TaxID=2942276 RepID=UPI002018F096|nr:hypothetical protein [Marivita sp. GX14005]MCL3881909.1 hypothetical protein [Marivita sp. GX14005]